MKRGILQARTPVVWRDVGRSLARVTCCGLPAVARGRRAVCSVCGGYLGRHAGGRVYSPPLCVDGARSLFRD